MSERAFHVRKSISCLWYSPLCILRVQDRISLLERHAPADSPTSNPRVKQSETNSLRATLRDFSLRHCTALRLALQLAIRD
eukprot:scaffold4280_cov57-Cyclotella_meneghiniana.AAC.6